MAQPPIELRRLREMERLLAEAPKAVNRAGMNALNRTATRSRKDLVTDMRQATGVKAKVLRRESDISRAKLSAMTSRVTPSADGIPATEYRFTYLTVSGPTRAQILVDWFDGKKVAAGWINPRSRKKLPWRTRSHRGPLPRPEEALAPSVAAMQKVLLNGARIEKYQELLTEQYTETLRDQIAKL